jgi:hypothetical protein
VISDFNQGDFMTESKGTAVIDWFSFTFDGHFADSDPGLMFSNLLQQWMNSPICGDAGNGLHGFKHSVIFLTVRLGELLPVAVVAWGGQNQRQVCINQCSGCSLINDWRKPKRFVDLLVPTLRELTLRSML